MNVGKMSVLLFYALLFSNYAIAAESRQLSTLWLECDTTHRLVFDNIDSTETQHFSYIILMNDPAPGFAKVSIYNPALNSIDDICVARINDSDIYCKKENNPAYLGESTELITINRRDLKLSRELHRSQNNRLSIDNWEGNCIKAPPKRLQSRQF